MLEKLLISFAFLIVLMTAWYGIQRWTRRDDTDPTCDFMQGRWGCGDCAIADRCNMPGHSRQSPTP